MIAGLAIALARGAVPGGFGGKTSSKPAEVTFLRLSDFAGMEESPAFSPDGKSVAFVSDSTGSRQVWIRLLAGGPPLQLTPRRWGPPRAQMVAGFRRHHLFHAASGRRRARHSVGSFGLGRLSPPARFLMSGADVSHDGKHLAFFRLNGKQMELVVADRDGSNAQSSDPGLHHLQLSAAALVAR